MNKHVFVDFSPGRVKMLSGELSIGENRSQGLCLIPQFPDVKDDPLSIYLTFKCTHAIDELIGRLQNVKIAIQQDSIMDEPLPLEG